MPSTHALKPDTAVYDSPSVGEGDRQPRELTASQPKTLSQGNKVREIRKTLDTFLWPLHGNLHLPGRVSTRAKINVNDLVLWNTASGGGRHR